MRMDDKVATRTYGVTSEVISQNSILPSVPPTTTMCFGASWCILLTCSAERMADSNPIKRPNGINLLFREEKPNTSIRPSEFPETTTQFPSTQSASSAQIRVTVMLPSLRGSITSTDITRHLLLPGTYLATGWHCRDFPEASICQHYLKLALVYEMVGGLLLAAYNRLLPKTTQLPFLLINNIPSYQHLTNLEVQEYPVEYPILEKLVSEWCLNALGDPGKE